MFNKCIVFCVCVCVCGRLTMVGKKTFEGALTLVLERVQLEVECLKGYGTIKSLETTVIG